MRRMYMFGKFNKISELGNICDLCGVTCMFQLQSFHRRQPFKYDMCDIKRDGCCATLNYKMDTACYVTKYDK